MSAGWTAPADSQSSCYNCLRPLHNHRRANNLKLLNKSLSLPIQFYKPLPCIVVFQLSRAIEGQGKHWSTPPSLWQPAKNKEMQHSNFNVFLRNANLCWYFGFFSHIKVYLCCRRPFCRSEVERLEVKHVLIYYVAHCHLNKKGFKWDISFSWSSCCPLWKTFTFAGTLKRYFWWTTRSQSLASTWRSSSGTSIWYLDKISKSRTFD